MNASSYVGGPRIRRELRTVRTMIDRYCVDHHNPTRKQCGDCSELWEYARKRLEKCPFQEDKATCAKCPIHCYRSQMRERIRDVMKYSGPRMVLKHPILAILHKLDGNRSFPAGRAVKGRKTKGSLG